MKQTLSALRRYLPIFAVTCLVFCVPDMRAQANPAAQIKIMMPEDLSTIMPGTVFFRGQSASAQLRNTFGLRFPDGSLMLAALVDSSGYSSGLKQKYQGYLISEITLTINGTTLPAGSYGFGFIAKNQFVVMDIGAHDVLKVPYQTDAALSRPRPLLIEAGKNPGSYRLYEGRSFVSIRVK